MKLALCIAAFCAFAAPAFAQDLPRFEGLEQQQQLLQQQAADKQATAQQKTLDHAARPNSGVSAAERALLALQFARDRENQLRPLKQQQDIQRTERDLAEQALPNRTIPPFSSAVVTDPARYTLPPAPKGQYYARVGGRFVLVDAASQLVTKVLDPKITDPTADVPAGPSPLPVPTISASSSLGIPEFRSLGLPPPAIGHFYARLGDSVVLVDRQTEQPVGVVWPN